MEEDTVILNVYRAADSSIRCYVHAHPKTQLPRIAKALAHATPQALDGNRYKWRPGTIEEFEALPGTNYAWLLFKNDLKSNSTFAVEYEGAEADDEICEYRTCVLKYLTNSIKKYFREGTCVSGEGLN